MSRLFDRKAVGVVLVALLVLTAGCSGLTGGESPLGGDGQDDEDSDEDEDEDEEETETETTAETEAEADGKDDGEETLTAPGTDFETPEVDVGGYEFQTGESYTYQVGSGATAQELTWEVLSVQGDQVTVEVTSEAGGRTSSSTLEGPQDEIFQQATGDMTALLFVSLRVSTVAAEGESLSMGNTWTVRSENLVSSQQVSWETAEVEVIDTDTYAGIECSVIEITPDDGSDVLTSCVNQDYPFALSLTQRGGAQFAVELTGTSRQP